MSDLRFRGTEADNGHALHGGMFDPTEPVPLDAEIDRALEWSDRPLLIRHTLNGLQPRTLQDADRDPYDWGEESADVPQLLRVLDWVSELTFVQWVVIGAVGGAVAALVTMAGMP